MSLKIVRFLQRVIGGLLIVYGIYLIFVTQQFFGTLAIILAFLIFPTIGKKEESDHFDSTGNSDSTKDNASPSWSGESDSSNDGGSDSK